MPALVWKLWWRIHFQGHLDFKQNSILVGKFHSLETTHISFIFKGRDNTCCPGISNLPDSLSGDLLEKALQFDRLLDYHLLLRSPGLFSINVTTLMPWCLMTVTGFSDQVMESHGRPLSELFSVQRRGDEPKCALNWGVWERYSNPCLFDTLFH